MVDIKSIIASGVHFRMEAKKAEGGLPESLCSALANTVIHADYYGRRGIVIEKKRGNIMFFNPGVFLPNVKEALGGLSKLSYEYKTLISV